MNVRLMLQKTKPNRAGLCVIYVEVSINPKGGKKEIIRIPTGEKVPPKYWGRKQEVTAGYAGYSDINNAIIKKKLEVQQVIREKDGATLTDIKLEFEKRTNIEPEATLIQLFEQYKAFKSKSLTENGMKNIVGLYNTLVDFEEETKKTLYPKSLDVKFYDEFCSFCRKKQSNNTIYKRTEIFRIFLNYLTERGLNDNLTYKKWQLPKTVSTQIITLTKSELDALFVLETTNNRIDNARDLFVFLCSTGLRFSDALSIKPHHVVNGHIRHRASKTQEIVSIPLNKYSKAILEKHGNDITPLSISNQKFNEAIKDACRAAGITEVVAMHKLKGGKVEDEAKEKCELISSHAGRRTFASLSLELGIRQDVVMAMTGHRDYRSFKKYVEHSNRIKEAEMDKWNL
ncbi:tyrosine-type recombinase/integrase [Pontibacter harenae]|uniref:tyrosine-type recombinase/integrase n=1 Tax=Pontibacter harenae TaxID=2894083 RepID=UPI001E2EAE06|nr:tyrosine-type recombinase/integrase [Pontibacter harenae]MCC9167432.1 site-specific integrase [Pontibacter harenae]